MREIVRGISPVIGLTDEEADAIAVKARVDAAEMTGSDERTKEWARQCALSIHNQKVKLGRPERFICKQDGGAFVLCANPDYQAA